MFERPEATAEQMEAVFGQLLREVLDATEKSVCVGVAFAAPILARNDPVFGPPSNSERRWGRLDVGGVGRPGVRCGSRAALMLRELFAVSVSAAAMEPEAGRKVPAEGGASW